MKVQNVTVELDHIVGALGSRFGTCVAGEVNGTRYHIWINGETLEHSDEIYQHLKSEPASSRRSGVRTLDASLERNARVVAALLEAVRRDDLISKGRAELAERRAKERAERQAQERAERAREALENAAPALLAAAKVIALTPHVAAYLEREDPKALEQLRAAIGAAEAA